MTGVGKLVRLILRRDRVLLPLWVVILGVLPATYISSFKTLFPTAVERQQYAEPPRNPEGSLHQPSDAGDVYGTHGPRP